MDLELEPTALASHGHGPLSKQEADTVGWARRPFALSNLNCPLRLDWILLNYPPTSYLVD